jgi:hypothetical protein
MSGWDEGNVFYSDQNLEDGGDENGDKLVTRHSSQRKFKEFIRSYGDVKGPFPYRYVCESSFSYLCVCVCVAHCFSQCMCLLLAISTCALQVFTLLLPWEHRLWLWLDVSKIQMTRHDAQMLKFGCVFRCVSQSYLHTMLF